MFSFGDQVIRGPKVITQSLQVNKTIPSNTMTEPTHGVTNFNQLALVKLDYGGSVLS